MILTVGNTKGGVGKTTLALNIAIARALEGRDVWFIDGDRQGTGQIALSIRSESGVIPAIACAQYVDGAMLRQQVSQTAKKFDDVVIDVGGRDSTAFRSALTLTDVLIVPFAPRSFEVWSLADMAHLIEEAQAVRGDFPVLAVLNNADATGTENEEAIEAIADYPTFRYVNAPIGRRKAISRATGKGISVLEAKPKDAKACEEIETLIHAIFR